jgi:hypothetical protein
MAGRGWPGLLQKSCLNVYVYNCLQTIAIDIKRVNTDLPFCSSIHLPHGSFTVLV